MNTVEDARFAAAVNARAVPLVNADLPSWADNPWSAETGTLHNK